MKRLLGICLLISALSFPVFAGHTHSGDNYCTCGTPGCIEDYPGECSGQMRLPSSNTPRDSTAEVGIALVALLLWLRLKA
jgi:hypothetical protein